MTKEIQWKRELPIYLQLRERIIALIIEGTLKEGEAVPSIRTIGVEYRMNPLTALRTYQKLADDGLLESRRGPGMFVSTGARARLLAEERARFKAEEWPNIVARIKRLELDFDDLLLQLRRVQPKQKRK